MLRKSLQQTLLRTRLPISRRTLNPISYRLFFTSLIRRQEFKAMKPTSDSLGFEPTTIKKAGRPIYLDMQATSPMGSRVLDAMYGWETEEAVEKAREEHKCILESCRSSQQKGFDVTYLPVQSNGLIDLNQLKETIRPDISIISIITANKADVMQLIDAINKLSAGKVPLDVNTMNIDLMSISGHKLYIPKGVGALYVRRRPRVRLEAVQIGDGQERGIRSGTVPHPLVVVLDEDCKVAIEEMEYNHQRISKLSKRLIYGTQSKAEHVYRNGDPVHSYPGYINLSFDYVEGESLIMTLKDLALSSGSACTSASLEPSYVLRALGADDEMAHSSIHFGIGRFRTEEEIEFVINKVSQHVDGLREMSPLWEMVQEGIDLKSIQ
ncbi:hypothetical protein G6F37_003854 [Rhizopus arrhizus]|nr:hypothetical protein G6F38_002933 [Rhizopus arrhizus]KAG1160588.1 hypothetical protein G6F37_003854 [Rhizopus arrhizus]